MTFGGKNWGKKEGKVQTKTFQLFLTFFTCDPGLG